MTVENRFVAEKRIAEIIADMKKTDLMEPGIALTCEEEDALVLAAWGQFKPGR